MLDVHDGFSLRPKKPVKNYKDNPGNSKVQGKFFVHMNNVSASEHVVNENKIGRVVDLALSSLLDVKVSDIKKTLLNPTKRYVMLVDIIDQSRR